MIWGMLGTALWALMRAGPAERAGQCAVHVNDPFHSGPFMQVIHILRDENHLAVKLGLKLGQNPDGNPTAYWDLFSVDAELLTKDWAVY